MYGSSPRKFVRTSNINNGIQPYFDRKQYTADWWTEGNSNTSRTGCCLDLPHFPWNHISQEFPLETRKRTLAARVGAEHPSHDVPNATSYVNRWSLLSNWKPRCNDKWLTEINKLHVNMHLKDGLTNVRLLINRVQPPKYPCITKPAIIHLISEIPEPAAYRANVLTREAETKANIDYTDY